MPEDQDKYIPALRYRWLTSLYDPIVRWAIRESTVKGQLVNQADIALKQKVLDLGCGTATLTILLKQTYPEAEVIGLCAIHEHEVFGRLRDLL
jgi:trans-aconitate methyltransferase